MYTNEISYENLEPILSKTGIIKNFQKSDNDLISLFLENLNVNFTKPEKLLDTAIHNAFGSMNNLLNEIKELGQKNNWVFLAIDPYLNIYVTSKQTKRILLAICCNHHQYEQQYLNRQQFLNSITNIINWKVVSRRYYNYLFY